MKYRCSKCQRPVTFAEAKYKTLKPHEAPDRSRCEDGIAELVGAAAALAPVDE